MRIGKSRNMPLSSDFSLGRRKYAVRFTPNDETGYHKIEILKLGRNGKETLIATSIVTFWNATLCDSSTFVRLADSYSSKEGEIAYQMFTPRVYRKPYEPGMVLMSTSIDVRDMMEARGDGLFERAFMVLLRMLSEKWASIVYYTYIGVADMPKAKNTPAEMQEAISNGKELKTLFAESHFAVFRCINGMHFDKSEFIALYSSAVLNDDFLREQQSEIAERPKKNDAGYLDFRDMGNVFHQDAFVDRNTEGDSCIGKLMVKTTWCANDWDPRHSFSLSVCKDDDDSAVLLEANFSVVHFGLADPRSLARLRKDYPDLEEEYEVAMQLFYPSVKREPYEPGRVVLLNDLHIPDNEIFVSHPTLMRDVFFRVLESIDWYLTYKDISLKDAWGSIYLAYLGRPQLDMVPLEEEYNDVGEWDEEGKTYFREKMNHRAAMSRLMYELCKNAGIPVIRCRSAHNPKFSDSDYIAFVPYSDYVAISYIQEDVNFYYENFYYENDFDDLKKYFDEKGNVCIPAGEEDPPAISQPERRKLVAKARKKYGIIDGNVSLKRTSRVYGYSLLKDIVGEYVMRDIYETIQEDEFQYAMYSRKRR